MPWLGTHSAVLATAVATLSAPSAPPQPPARAVSVEPPIVAPREVAIVIVGHERDAHSMEEVLGELFARFGVSARTRRSDSLDLHDVVARRQPSPGLVALAWLDLRDAS